MVFKASRDGIKAPVRPVSRLARWLGPNPTCAYHQERAAAPRSRASRVAHSSNTAARLRGSNEFVDPKATAGTEEGIFMQDLVDCRAGMFSPAFADLIFGMKNAIKYAGVAKTAMSEQERLTLTLIGAERTFSLEFPTQRERDFFYVGMHALMDRCKHDDEGVAEALVGRPTRTARQSVTEHAGGASDSYGAMSLLKNLNRPKSAFDSKGVLPGGRGKGEYGPVATLDGGSDAPDKPSAAGILRAKGNVGEASRMALLGDDDDEPFVPPPNWDTEADEALAKAPNDKARAAPRAPPLSAAGLNGSWAQATL